MKKFISLHFYERMSCICLLALSLVVLLTGCGTSAPVSDDAVPEITEAPESAVPESEPIEEETADVSDVETETMEEETNDPVDEMPQEETEYDRPENVREFKGGMLEETFDAETEKSDYRIVYKDNEQPVGYQDMAFTIKGIAPQLYEIGDAGAICNGTTNELIMYHGAEGEDLTKMTDEEILEWWLEPDPDPNKYPLTKSEDENYIRVYYETDAFVNGLDVLVVPRNCLIQKKDTNELYGIRYDSKVGMDTKEDVFKIFDTVEFGDFTEDDLGR